MESFEKYKLVVIAIQKFQDDKRKWNAKSIIDSIKHRWQTKVVSCSFIDEHTKSDEAWSFVNWNKEKTQHMALTPTQGVVN